jgi:1,4-dihydroxy-2-naphthoate octaprenyltransferase
LLVLGAFQTLTGDLHLVPFLAALPLGSLAASILHASHLQTFSADVTAGVRTLAALSGWERAQLLFYALAGLPYVLVALLILTSALPAWSWLTFLSLPLVGRSVLAVYRSTAEQTQRLAGLDRQMAQTYLAFGVLLMGSLILG